SPMQIVDWVGCYREIPGTLRKCLRSLRDCRRLLVVLLILASSTTISVHAQTKSSQSDPLPSWSEGPVKQRIIDFVSRITSVGGPDYVPVEERIATFDNDGTLWVEQPLYTQFVFALDRVKALASQHPEWKEKQPFKAALEGDTKALEASGEKGIAELMIA